ncbi:MAG: DMT family transporter [Chloroflexota bacterium]|nr:DMT family transporter [Chloroflexota bacterium]
MTEQHSPPVQHLAAAVLTPVFLGVAPIFGKMAITAGADSFTVAALRTLVAVLLLWVVYALFFRRYLYIYPAGLLGCIVVGTVNGIGSLFYYSGLGFLDASLVQLLNGMYIVFAVLLARLNGEAISRRVAVHIGLSIVAIFLITGFALQPVNWLGVGLMLGSALMFAGTLILSQYVLYEMPAPTATLYILTTMGVLVLMVWAAVSGPGSTFSLETAFMPILLLGITTALSRLTMFASVQVFGSLRTVVIAVAEIAVALGLAFLLLGERMTLEQWAGVVLLVTSLLLIRTTDLTSRGVNPNALLVRDMASVQFQRIAFHRAFGKAEQDNEFGIMAQISTKELQAIRKMMGAEAPVDPFPMARNLPVDEEEARSLLAPTKPTKPKLPPSNPPPQS